MKKFLLVLFFLLFLTGCNQSVGINNEKFIENINYIFEDEIISSENSVTENYEKELITYYFPNGYDICCSVLSQKSTGIIIKYTVSGYAWDEKLNQFSEKFYSSITENNTHISVKEQIADDLKIFVFEDLRYKEEKPIN